MTNETLRQAMRRAFNFGQTYWQQADSDFISYHKKADETKAKFEALVEETCSAIDAEQAKGREAVENLLHPQFIAGFRAGRYAGLRRLESLPEDAPKPEIGSVKCPACQTQFTEFLITPAQPAREWSVITEGTAAAYLHDLCEALNNAFISTWQSTHAWQKQLDAANEYLREKNAGQPVVKEN